MQSTDKPTIAEPEWNSSTLTMRIWFNELVRWIPFQDKCHRSLIERGYFIYRDQTICSSTRPVVQKSTPIPYFASVRVLRVVLSLVCLHTFACRAV